MDNQKKLELTLCGMLPYGLQAQFRDTDLPDTEIALVHSVGFVDDSIDISLSVNGWNLDLGYEVKPLLHSMSKLTEPILEGGLIPIVELAKLFHKGNTYPVTHYDNVRLHDETAMVNCCVGNVNTRHTYFVVFHKNIMSNNADIFEKLKEWHFNIYDLPKEMYIEKSTL